MLWTPRCSGLIKFMNGLMMACIGLLLWPWLPSAEMLRIGRTAIKKKNAVVDFGSFIAVGSI